MGWKVDDGLHGQGSRKRIILLTDTGTHAHAQDVLRGIYSELMCAARYLVELAGGRGVDMEVRARPY